MVVIILLYKNIRFKGVSFVVRVLYPIGVRYAVSVEETGQEYSIKREAHFLRGGWRCGLQKREDMKKIV